MCTFNGNNVIRKTIVFRGPWSSRCHVEPWAKKKRWKIAKNQDFMGKENFFSTHPALQPLGNFSHMAACRNSSENTRKMSLIPVFNKK
jgi:hypothetical protein